MQQKRVIPVKQRASRFEMTYRLAQTIAVLITFGAIVAVAAACNAIATM